MTVKVVKTQTQTRDMILMLSYVNLTEQKIKKQTTQD